ncbi:MAG: DegT/DnrJ/EryC1/StrS family aminotransferase [Methanomicrobiales archaeon]|nr:DegT/DnrJ/EryC1/StrS family aminotransferase [Methanomicrobiales archaeon]
MQPIPVSRPSIGEEELAAVRRVFASGWLGLGADVLEFEKAIGRFLGASHVVCTNTGTTALHLALDSLGIGPGDEVLLPAFTYVASAQAVSATGARPVFCDIGEADLGIDAGDAARRITRRTKAILPVHYRGIPCDLDRVQELAREHDLHVIEDAAHAFGSSYKGKKIGSFGEMACFSFDPVKNITCGEGGAVVFRDAGLLGLLQQKRILGIDKDTWSRYRNERSWFYDVVTRGYRYHMSNINAAIGLVQLGRFEAMNRRRIEVARRYDEAFGALDGVKILENRGYEGIGLFAYMIRVPSRRDGLMEYLTAHGVGSGIHYIPSHLFTFYREEGLRLPVTEQVYREILSLPLFPDITDEEVEQVIREVSSGLRELA